MAASTGTVLGTRPSAPSKRGVTLGYLLGAVVLLLCGVFVGADWMRLLDLPERSVTFAGLLSSGVFQNPLEEPYSGWWLLSVDFMLDSLYIAWVGTVIGALLSLPLGFLAARNVSPAPVVAVTRFVLNVIRAIPEFIIAIAVLVPLYGLHPAAGALALGIGSVGTLGKLSSEAIEGIQPGPVESIRAAGGRTLPVLRWGVLPQVLPEIIAFWLYRFEINIRAGAILGALGLGGIGFLLEQLFSNRAWDRIGIALVVTIVITIVVDQISAAVRKRIISGVPAKTEAAAYL